MVYNLTDRMSHASTRLVEVDSEDLLYKRIQDAKEVPLSGNLGALEKSEFFAGGLISLEFVATTFTFETSDLQVADGSKFLPKAGDLIQRLGSHAADVFTVMRVEGQPTYRYILKDKKRLQVVCKQTSGVT